MISTKVLIKDIMVMSTFRNETITLCGHPSHAKV